MKVKVLINALTLCVASLTSVPALAKANVKLDIVPDHANAHYRGGESAVLEVTATDTNGVKLTQGEIKVWADNFGDRKVLAERVVDLARENPFKTSATRSTPGFLRWNFSGADKFSQTFGVGYDTDRIVPGTPEPVDFDAFWSEAIAKYDREIPAPPEEKFDEELSDKDWDVWRLTLAAPGGRNVYGFVTRPKGASGKLPARIGIAAAGYGGWSQSPSRVKGHVSLMMTVYPFVPDPKLRGKADYDAMNAEAKRRWKCSSYSTAGISSSREEFFFYPVILANRRAIEWFSRRPDVDASNITYSGTSQGGGLGLAAMALSPCITRGAVFVPALTDLLSSKIESRFSGWPRVVENQSKEGKAAATRNAPYFCGVNFARRIHAPIRFTVGFIDSTCSPHAVYAAFNVCPSGDKMIVDGIGMPHQVFFKHYESGIKWLDLLK